uniref:Uncharacterized protein n=1 Tax=Rhizophora mucronata TaxID=61149 RepID=A0A2P2P4F8_RHIMU
MLIKTSSSSSVIFSCSGCRLNFK